MKKLMIILSIFFCGINYVFANDKVEFLKCVDGDTIKVSIDSKEYTVRMLAIDTPESVHPKKEVEYYGKEASDYTCNKITKAKEIELEYDDNSDKMDKYDRLLAWVFVDGNLLQEDLVENGYAKVAYLYGDYKYTKRLQEKQEIASAKGIGIWDTEAASNYQGSVMSTDDTTNNSENKDYSMIDIIMIVVLLLVITFVGDKSIKKKAKKKLKTYLK